MILLAPMRHTDHTPPNEPTRHLDVLELHVTHACNLTCESCSHYSNHGHRGHVRLSEAAHWMSLWSRRFTVGQFRLLGGEPTIHPELPAFVGLVRRHWRSARIRIVTNGFFLHRHPGLPATLAADGHADIAVSVHHDAPEYRERLKPIFDLLAAWQQDHGITVDIRESHGNWTRRYHGFGPTMLPYQDGLPRRSWEICPAKYCKQLFQGRLWKCAPLAYLQLQKAKYDLSEKWDPYLAYLPLNSSCSDRELDQFIAQEDEPACAMCSAERRRLTLPVPLPKVAKPDRPPAKANANPAV